MTDNLSMKDIMIQSAVVKDTDTFEDVMNTMVSENTNSVLVVDEEGKLAGEVNVVQLLSAVVPDYTEEDAIAAHFATEDTFKEEIARTKNMTVKDFMVTDKKVVTESASLMEAAVIAIERGQARIPVVNEEGKPIGAITRRGLKKIMAKHLNIEE